MNVPHARRFGQAGWGAAECGDGEAGFKSRGGCLGNQAFTACHAASASRAGASCDGFAERLASRM